MYKSRKSNRYDYELKKVNLLNISSLIERLRILGVRLERGLTAEELLRVEQTYAIRFPPDLRELLQRALPYGESFLNWRNFSARNVKHIQESLNWPLDGLLFDVENNRFWPERWGPRPQQLAEAKAAAAKHFEHVPKLIPVRGHRYLPTTPYEAGNPVFSVYQTDVIPYGENLADYFEIEYRHKLYEELNFERIKPIDFWGELGGLDDVEE